MTCTYTWIHEFVTKDVDTCTNRTCLVALGGNILEHTCFHVVFFFYSISAVNAIVDKLTSNGQVTLSVVLCFRLNLFRK